MAGARTVATAAQYWSSLLISAMTTELRHKK
jgi:hypothetical protein